MTNKTEIQARWRAKTDKQRVELYLPPETVRRIDEAVAAGKATSRAELVAALVDGGLSTGSNPEPTEALQGAAEPLRIAFHMCSDRRATKVQIGARIEKALSLLVPLYR